MTLTWLWVAMGGGVGAALRHLANVLVERSGRPASRATLLVNVVGSFLLGVLMGLGLPASAPEWAAVVGVGVLGGFTTFSTASAESAQLWHEGRRGAAIGRGMVMLVASAAAAAVGWALGNALM